MLTCCTALTTPRRVANSTVRSRTSSSGGAVTAAASVCELCPLAPLLRGEGWGEGPLSANARERGVRGGPRSPGSPRRFFFFQAEDGIRDLYVTGVQTCALPI